MTNTHAGESPRPRAVLAVALLLHAALLWYFTPKGLLFSGKPIHEYDYALHAYQVDRAIRAFASSGHLWSYDPFVLAGQPANVVEDVTNKGLELFVISAQRLGGNPWIAFNLYVFSVHLAMPFMGWLAARLFRLTREASAITVLLWVLLWHFDSLLHWCWHVGMIAWGAASTLIVVTVGLMYRAVRDHRASTYLALGTVATIVTLVHPFAALTLMLPLAALYAASFRRIARREHLFLAAGLLAAASTSLVWIGPAYRFRHDIGDVDAFLWPTLSYVFFDWFDLLKDVLMTGQPVRTAFRTLALGLSVIGLLRWHRARDDRALPLGVLVAGSFVLAYLSGYSSALRQTQPYRHMGPATLAAALVSGSVLAEALSSKGRILPDRNARVMLLLASVLALPHFVRTVLQYLPTLVPDRPLPTSAFREGPVPGAPNLELPPIVMGHWGPKPEYVAIGKAIERDIGQRGRVVVYDWVLGEYLATFTSVPILGGIPQRNVPHVAAHPLRHDLTPEGPGDDPFRRYLEQYAVSALVVFGEAGPLDARTDLLEPGKRFGDYRILLTRAEPSYFARGRGRIGAQAINSIRVIEASGPELVLRFHFLETLRCRPGCAVERTPADRDGAGFVLVRSPPERFELYNSYD